MVSEIGLKLSTEPISRLLFGPSRPHLPSLSESRSRSCWPMEPSAWPLPPLAAAGPGLQRGIIAHVTPGQRSGGHSRSRPPSSARVRCPATARRQGRRLRLSGRVRSRDACGVFLLSESGSWSARPEGRAYGVRVAGEAISKGRSCPRRHSARKALTGSTRVARRAGM
jgi:hypothetical protein